MFKFILAAAMMTFSLAASAKTFKTTCYPELPGPNVDLEFSYNVDTMKVSIRALANGKKAELCPQGKLADIKWFLTDKKATSKIGCKSGRVTITKDFDETILDVSGLGTRYGNNRFMCH